MDSPTGRQGPPHPSILGGDTLRLTPDLSLRDDGDNLVLRVLSSETTLTPDKAGQLGLLLRAWSDEKRRRGRSRR
jgi:hypothetical protein